MNLSSLHENWQGILTALVAGITLLALLLGRRAPAMAKRGEDGLTLVLGILADSIRQSNKRSLEMASRDPDETPLSPE